MNADNVFRTVCAGFNETPAECYPDFDETIGQRKQSSSKIGTGTIVMIVIIVVLINVLLIYCYRRYSQREMKDEMQLQISSMMSQYFALSDNKDKRPSVNPVTP